MAGWISNVVHDGAPNQLLLDQGNGKFVEQTPPLLAQIGNGRSSVFADFDGDGDEDLFLPGDGLLLRK